LGRLRKRVCDGEPSEVVELRLPVAKIAQPRASAKQVVVKSLNVAAVRVAAVSGGPSKVFIRGNEGSNNALFRRALLQAPHPETGAAVRRATQVLGVEAVD